MYCVVSAILSDDCSHSNKQSAGAGRQTTGSLQVLPRRAEDGRTEEGLAVQSMETGTRTITLTEFVVYIHGFYLDHSLFSGHRPYETGRMFGREFEHGEECVHEVRMVSEYYMYSVTFDYVWCLYEQ